MPNRSPRPTFFLPHVALGLAAILPLAGLPASPAEAVPLYRLTDLGNDDFSVANAINDSGQIVGAAGSATGPVRATLFDPTGAGDNINLGGFQANAINDRGQIVGDATPTTGGFVRATLFDPTGGGDDLGLGRTGVDFSFANDINNAGQIVGQQADIPTLFDPTGAGADRDLDEGFGAANAINDRGQIVGFVADRSILFDPTGAGDNRDLGGGAAFAINNRGQIVGEEAGRATLFDPTGGGDNQDLGTLGGDRSRATAINESGQIVGFAENAAGERRAFLFDAGMIFDLNGLIDPHDPLFGEVVLTDATDINAGGAILANQVLPDTSRAFLLTPLQVQPVPEPGPLALLAAGLAGLGLLGRRRRA